MSMRVYIYIQIINQRERERGIVFVGTMGRVENGSDGDLFFMNNIIEKRKERDGWSSCL